MKDLRKPRSAYVNLGKLAAPVLLTVILSACASSPSLEEYPRRHIDRPYTIPDDVTTFETVMATGVIRDNSSSFALNPIPIPLILRQGLSDNLTLLWTPLPLGLQYQISKTEKEVWGATLAVGLRFFSGLTLIPQTTGYYRRALAENLALVATLSYVPTIDLDDDDDDFNWATNLGLRPVFQLSDVFALAPKVVFSLQSGPTDRFTRGSDVKPSSNSKLVLPLGAWFGWSFHRRWDLSGNYTFSRIGHENGFTSHIGVFTLVHYW